ncbi:unnamed protein product [Porites evermanni]|uniref:Lupus La protein n=1 Tax=Porites evermanni TaxID=104178 RepID=A0ABN8Q782_9CNID|nr:unnamed protein product [Porites evermanni]
MAANEGTNGHAEVPSDLEKKIIKQIEFYFGDKNLPRDKFLRQKVDEDEGWVTLECLTTFNRLKALSTDTDAIAKALRKSEAGLVEVSEDNKKVRRVTTKPLPEETAEARYDAKTKTVYCKGFPAETTIDQLEEFFSDKGKAVLIKMRRGENHLFKGSVFVEFSTVDEAKAFVATEALKYNEQELIKMMKCDYFKKKEEEFKQKKEKQKEEEGEKQKETKEEKKDEDENEEESLKYDSGCVLHFKNVGEQTSREDLKSLFGEHEDIAWVDFTRGESEGHVRFSKEGGAQRVIDALKAKGDGKIVIREAEATLRVLEGDEEKSYWKKAQEDREKGKQKKGKKFRGNQGGRSGGGRGRGKRRSFDRQQNKPGQEKDDETQKATHTRFDDGEPAEKKVKTEED